MVGHSTARQRLGGSRTRRSARLATTVNDLPMIRAAGLGVAMGQCAAVGQGGGPTGSPRRMMKDGLVEVVRWLLEGLGIRD